MSYWFRRKFDCASQGNCVFEWKNHYLEQAGSRLIVITLSVLLLNACSAPSNKNVPVVRLPTSVKYSQDPRYYIVRPGDTLYSIAWHQGLDYRELAKKNHIGKRFLISIGQKLKVNFKNDKDNSKITVRTLQKISKSDRKNSKLRENVKVKPYPKVSSSLNKRVTNWRWPVTGKLVGQFSSSRGGNKGIDIATSGPQPVRAIADGIVVYSGSGLRGYGQLVIIKHNDDYLSAYAYNDKIRVKEKIEVKVGEIIADTGINGLHKNRLHLEIRYKGKPVNPLKYLKK